MNREEIRPPRLQQHRVVSGSRSGLGLVLVLIALTVGGAALVKTLVKNKTHAIGRDQEAVERQIAALRQEIDALELDIKSVLTPKHLRERLMARRTMLEEIDQKKVVKIPAVPVAKAAEPGKP